MPRPRQTIVEARSLAMNSKQVSQAVVTAMPVQRGDRPVRSTKKVQLKAGYVDSSTLLFDSDDEGTDDAKSEGENDSGEEGKTEGYDEDHHVAKKPRVKGQFKAQAKEPSPPPPDSSCLSFYPKTYEAVQKWNRLLGLPPPRPMSDASSNETPEREVGSPELPESQMAKTPAQHNFATSRAVQPDLVINKNPSYDETKAGFEKLPGEIRNKIYTLVFKRTYPVDFLQRHGFSHSAAFLRVNKVVHNEARAFIYGEHRFLFGYNTNKTGEYFEPTWKELGWTHVRRFLTDIGPENVGLIQNVGITFSDANPSGNPGTTLNQRRFTYNKDLVWILNHLGQHGKILSLTLGFCGRRNVKMILRDGDFLNALKGVKTDKLLFGDPEYEGSSRYNSMGFDKVDHLVQDLLEDVMVRPVPLKDLDPRLEF